jgi:hypothetical protein
MWGIFAFFCSCAPITLIKFSRAVADRSGFHPRTNPGSVAQFDNEGSKKRAVRGNSARSGEAGA